jgi:hypothetical protein
MGGEERRKEQRMENKKQGYTLIELLDSREEGAYLSWSKAWCTDDTPEECPGMLLSSHCSNPANPRNGCAVYLGKTRRMYRTNDCGARTVDRRTFFAFFRIHSTFGQRRNCSGHMYTTFSV